MLILLKDKKRAVNLQCISELYIFFDKKDHLSNNTQRLGVTERKELTYMRTWKNIIKPEKDAAFGEYLAKNTADAKCMYNVANFYIRNTMTGIKKSPEERTALETEVLHYVFTGIQKANADARARYEKKRKEYLDMKSEEGNRRAAELKCTVFPYPTREKWFLSYNTLDAIFKATENPTYCRMNSQVNQNAIRRS